MSSFASSTSVGTGGLVTVCGTVTDEDGVVQPDKSITCRSELHSSVTTTTSADGAYTVLLQPECHWKIQLGGIGMESKVTELFVPLEGVVGGDADFIATHVTGSIRELNEYGGGITKPADLHVGLTDKTKQSLEQSISAQLDAAREYAKTAKTLQQNSAVPDIAVKMHLDSLRKACNIYAQHTVCLRNPPPELKALHDTFTGNMSVLNIPQISGPEVELLENEMYENLIQESSFSPLAANASAADMVGCYSNAMSVDIECLADKYSISSTGMFANWKRRRFTLCGCVLTYFNGAVRAGGLVISKDSNILSDSATGIHSQSRHFNRELLIDFAAPGIAGGSRLQLFIRFDDACTKDIWELSMNNLIQFLNI